MGPIKKVRYTNLRVLLELLGNDVELNDYFILSKDPYILDLGKD